MRNVVVLPQPDREVHTLDGGKRSERLGYIFELDLCHGA